MRTSSFRLSASLALTLLFVGGVAVAEEEGFGTRYRRGVVLFNSGQYDRAIEELQAAYELRPKSLVLFNLAQAHRYAGHGKEALLLYERFLRQEPRSELRPEIEGYLGDLRAAEERTGEATAERPAPPEARPAPPAAAPAPAVRAALALQPEAPAPRRPVSPLRAAKWTLLATGLLASAAGAALLGIDGMQTCSREPGQRYCPQALDTRALGIAALAVGGAGLGTAGVLFGVDARRGREGQLAMLTATGRF